MNTVSINDRLGDGGLENVAILSTDASGNVTGLVDPTGGNPYGFAVFPKDVNGNAVANVIHRTGTLAELLALDGGNGEISVATEGNALVRHNGVAGGAVAFYRNYLYGIISGILIGTHAVPTGAAGIIAKFYSDLPVPHVNAQGELVFPDDVRAVPFSIILDITFGASALGTYRKVTLEYTDTASAGVWTEIAFKSVPASANANFIWVYTASAGTGLANFRLRSKVYQDSGADMNVDVSYVATISRY